MAALVQGVAFSRMGFFGFQAKGFLKIRLVINFNAGVSEKHVDGVSSQGKLVFL